MRDGGLRPTSPTEGAAASDDDARNFALTLGRALHTYGYPAHRLEDALSQVCQSLGARGQFFSTPTSLFASFGEGASQRTYHLRVEPGEVDLGKLSRLDGVRAAVARGARSAAEGAREVEGIVAAAPLYPAWLTTMCFALASGSAARFFGGGVREIGAGGAIGLVIGALALAAGKSPALRRVFEPVAAAVAALLSGVAASRVPSLSPYVATLAGLIVLIPGFSLTVAMAELAMRHLVSGTARLAGAAMTFLAIAFGVTAVATLASRLLGPAPVITPLALPEWTLFVAVLVAPLAFTVLLRAEPRDAPPILVAAALAFFCARAGAFLLGPGLGAFGGALAVALFGNLFSRLTGRPPVVAVVPGILLLVPGSLGFRSLSSLLAQDTLSGLAAAFDMILVAVSLAMGLVFANALLPAASLSTHPRR